MRHLLAHQLETQHLGNAVLVDDVDAFRTPARPCVSSPLTSVVWRRDEVVLTLGNGTVIPLSPDTPITLL